MNKFNEDTKNYLKLFGDKKFTKFDFISYLLPLLFKNGLTQLNEESLKKQLYFYFQNPQFEELFQDINLNPKAIDKEIDIYDALYQEKLFSGNITWDITKPYILNLEYDENIDLEKYEKKLSNDGNKVIKRMATELALIFKIENQSKGTIQICNSNPNKGYILVEGISNNENLSWKLVTDGEIQKKDIIYDKTLLESSFEDPRFSGEYIKFDECKVVSLNLGDATYAIMQGLKNSQVQQSVIYTTNLQLLQNLIEISDVIDETICEEKSYVRKLNIK